MINDNDNDNPHLNVQDTVAIGTDDVAGLPEIEIQLIYFQEDLSFFLQPEKQDAIWRADIKL